MICRECNILIAVIVLICLILRRFKNLLKDFIFEKTKKNYPMKPVILLSVFAIIVCSCSNQKKTTPEVLTPQWELVWEDNFDVPGLPDSAVWGYETGYIRNGEAQYYTESRLENARV